MIKFTENITRFLCIYQMFYLFIKWLLQTKPIAWARVALSEKRAKYESFTFVLGTLIYTPGTIYGSS